MSRMPSFSNYLEDLDHFFYHLCVILNHIFESKTCEIKRYLLLGRKAMTNLDSILRGRAIILLTNVRIVKAMVFPVVMYGCESWIIKEAEHQRIDSFKNVVLEEAPESPLDCKEIKPVNPKGNQS